MLNFFPITVKSIRRYTWLGLAALGLVLMVGGCASAPHALAPPQYNVLFKQSNKKIALKEHGLSLSPEMVHVQQALNAQHWDALAYWLARARSQPTLPPSEQRLIALASIRWQLAQQHYRQAEQALNTHRPNAQWPTFLTIQYWQLKTLWAENTHHPLALAQAHHHLSQLCPNAADSHHWALYQALQQLPVSRLKQLSNRRYQDKHWGGWIALALLSHAPDEAFERTRQRWQQHYQSHPAYDWSVPQADLMAHDKPLSIGVLLPLSGTHRAAGQAVQSGWLAHYYQYFQQVDDQPYTVHFYDTQSTLKGTQQALKQLSEHHTDLLVGPLLKPHVPITAQWANHHQIPLLLLNEHPDRPHNPIIHAIDLSPEFRGRVLAQNLNARAHQQVLVIAGDERKHHRALDQFEKHFTGEIRDRVFLSAEENWGIEIQQLLHIMDSQTRHEQLQQFMKRRLSSHPRIRADQTDIVLFLNAEQARQIKPLLSFYYADDIPLMADSSLFTALPAPNQDRDLDGILFPDWPIFFNPHPHPLITVLNNTQSHVYHAAPRLTLLGADAFEHVKQQAHWRRYPYLGRLTLSGFYHYHDNGRWQRLLKWGQFQAGQPRAVAKL